MNTINAHAAVAEARLATLWSSVGVPAIRADRLAAATAAGAVSGAVIAGVPAAIGGGMVGGVVGTGVGALVGGFAGMGIGAVIAGVGAVPGAIIGALLGGAVGAAIGIVEYGAVAGAAGALVGAVTGGAAGGVVGAGDDVTGPHRGRIVRPRIGHIRTRQGRPAVRARQAMAARSAELHRAERLPVSVASAARWVSAGQTARLALQPFAHNAARGHAHGSAAQ